MHTDKRGSTKSAFIRVHLWFFIMSVEPGRGAGGPAWPVVQAGNRTYHAFSACYVGMVRSTP